MKTFTCFRSVLLFGILLFHLGSFGFKAYGAAGDLDLSFDPGSGVDGTVKAVVVQPDGKVIIAGQFSAVKGLLRANLARLNADGLGDPTFVAGLRSDEAVTAVALQADGKLVVAGLFYQIYCDESGCYDYYEPGVLRLNANGSPDDSFLPAKTDYLESGEITSLTVQPDGRVLVVGRFLGLNGTNRGNLARLHSDGTLDASFATGAGANARVSSIALQPDGTSFISGPFSTVDGENRAGVARLLANGHLDPTFDAGFVQVRYPDCGPLFACVETTDITAIALRPDGEVLVGVWKRLIQTSLADGQETIADDYSVARLQADGGSDPAFVLATSAQLELVHGIIVQPDGRLLIRDGFNTTRISRLNANGSGDESFQPMSTAGSANPAALQPDGKVLFGGTSEDAGVHAGRRLSRLNADGTRDMSFDAGQQFEHVVSQLALQPDGRVLIGGPLVLGDPFFGPVSNVLAFVNGTNSHGRARLNADGSLDSEFIPAPFHPPLEARYHTENCLGDPRYACLHGFVSTALSAQSDGKVLMGGTFITTIYGDEVFYQVYNSFLGRFTATGGLETEFNLPDCYITAIAQQPDGKIVIGGSLTLNGINRTVARLNADGSVDDSFQTDPASALGGVVALQADGKVVVAGAGTVARLHSDGSRDFSFAFVSTTGGSASSLALQPDGKVLIGGSFTAVNGTNRNRIARVNGDGTVDLGFDPGVGANGAIASLVLQADGNILIGGDFLAVTGVVRPKVARLLGNDAPPSAEPEIVIEHPPGSRLEDATSSINFGTVGPGAPSLRIVTIRSAGLAELTNLSVAIDGVNASDFSIAVQPAGAIPGPAGTGTFSVEFSPQTRGTRTAVLHVASNDADENPFEITLTGERSNDAPVALADTATTAHATPVEIHVLANDSDSDLDSLTIAAASNGENGSAEVIATDLGPRIRYTPGAGFSGSDELSYSISDGMGGSAAGTVQVTVGRPVAMISRSLFSTGTEPGDDPNDFKWKRFGVPSIARNGRIAFLGTMTAPGEIVTSVNMGSNRGYGPPFAPHRVIAQTGGIALDSPGLHYGTFQDPLLNNDGAVVFVAKLTGRNSGGNSGIFIHYENLSYPGVIDVVLTGQEAPGVPGARWKSFTSVALSDGAFGDEIIAFTATMKGRVAAADDAGLWLAHQGTIALGLRKGASVSINGTPTTIRGFVALQAVSGAAGHGNGATGAGVLARVKFHDGTDGVVRVQMDENGPLVTAVARSGDSIEDSDLQLAAFSLPTQSSDGGAAFIAALAGGAGGGSAIVREDDAGLEVLVESGDAALPDGAAFFRGFGSLVVDSANRVSFTARLSGEGVNRRNDSGIWWDNGAQLQVIAREGDQPSGIAAGVEWASFSSLALPDGAAGPVFVARLRAAAPPVPNAQRISASNDLGVWAVDSTGELQLIVRTGDSLDGQRKIVALAVLNMVRGSPTQSRSTSNAGELIYRATFDDGSQQIVTVVLP